MIDFLYMHYDIFDKNAYATGKYKNGALLFSNSKVDVFLCYETGF